MEKKRRFESPELENIQFANEDIIVTSSFGDENRDPESGDVFGGQ